MGRRFLMFLLFIGVVVGFGSGIAHLCGWHRGYGAYGYGWHGGWREEREAYENHLADVCARAAERTLRAHPAPAEPPRPAAPPQ